MRASIKNNIKADLRDRKMTPIVIHHKLIETYTELWDRAVVERGGGLEERMRNEHCLYPAFVYTIST